MPGTTCVGPSHSSWHTIPVLRGDAWPTFATGLATGHFKNVGTRT
jgi:hypothetical protein